MKTLIVYTSKYGFTRDCVNLLKGKIHGDVEILDLNGGNFSDALEFDTLILGGPIYMGRIDKTLKSFLEKYEEEIINKIFAIFLSCGVPEKFEDTISNCFNEELLKNSLATLCIGGELRTDKMKIGDKFITKALKKSGGDGFIEPSAINENIDKLADVVNKAIGIK